MTINQTSSPSSDLWQLLRAAEGSQTSAVSSSTQTSSIASTALSGDSASVSDPGKLVKELELLSKTNPAEFKKITASIAEQLAAAKNSTDQSQAQALNTLASDFTKASQSGNLSALFSQQGGASESQLSATASTASAYSSNATNPIEKIFSDALHQIQTDLGGETSANSK